MPRIHESKSYRDALKYFFPNGNQSILDTFLNPLLDARNEGMTSHRENCAISELRRRQDEGGIDSLDPVTLLEVLRLVHCWIYTPDELPHKRRQEAAAIMGQKGGKNGSGDAKRRSNGHYAVTLAEARRLKKLKKQLGV